MSKAKLAILVRLALTPKLFSTPTEIGQDCGKPYCNASSWASRHLRMLVTQGYVSRSTLHRGRYRITTDGLAWVTGTAQGRNA